MAPRTLYQNPTRQVSGYPLAVMSFCSNSPIYLPYACHMHASCRLDAFLAQAQSIIISPSSFLTISDKNIRLEVPPGIDPGAPRAPAECYSSDVIPTS